MSNEKEIEDLLLTVKNRLKRMSDCSGRIIELDLIQFFKDSLTTAIKEIDQAKDLLK